METATQSIPVVYGTDPLRPNDIVLPAGVQTAPPNCPVCDVLLYPVTVNEKGDILFECLNGDGHYEAVFRVVSNTWEPRPGVVRVNWVKPGTKSKNPEVAAVQTAAKKLAVKVPRVQKRKVTRRTKRGRKGR